MNTKKEVLREHLGKYLEASCAEKGRILNHLVATLSMHRKSIIRALKREQLRRSKHFKIKKAGRRLLYTPDITYVLHEVWEIAGEICAERLKPILNEYLRILKRDRMWSFGDEITAKLLSMSLGTMKRRISFFVRLKAGGGRSTTKPSNLKELIPIRRGPWQNPDPGFGEIDTLVHCGSTLLGRMAYTVNFTDITTCWVESAAQIDKGQRRTQKSIEDIAQRLPFKLLGLDPDTGSEFINWQLKSWCEENKVELTRSRPNHRNDNAHIEQKNYASVRKFLGYERVDKESAVVLMNKLYRGPLRLYLNFFQPTMKCIKKERIGSRYKRIYDQAQTPYLRVLTNKKVKPEVKNKLKEIYATLNPAVLKKEIEVIINDIFKLQRRS